MAKTPKNIARQGATTPKITVRRTRSVTTTTPTAARPAPQPRATAAPLPPAQAQGNQQAVAAWVLGGLFVVGAFIFALAYGGWLNKPQQDAKVPPPAPIQQATTPAPAPQVNTAGTPICKAVDGQATVWSKEANACVVRRTDVAHLEKWSPSQGNDPKCVGKPVGFKYQETVTDPATKGVGIVTRVCGSRPN